MKYNFIDLDLLHDNLAEGVSEEELYSQVIKEIGKAKRAMVEQEREQREKDLAVCRVEIAKSTLRWLLALKVTDGFSNKDVEWLANELKNAEKDLLALRFALTSIDKRTFTDDKRTFIDDDDNIIKKFLDKI